MHDNVERRCDEWMNRDEQIVNTSFRPIMSAVDLSFSLVEMAIAT